MCAALTSNDFRLKLKAAPSGIFLFFGEEDYMKQWCLRELRRITGDGENDPFNIIRLSAGESDFTFGKLADACAALPVFSDSKLTELHELDFGTMNESRFQAFCETMQSIQPDVSGENFRNVLLIYTAAGEFDGGTEARPTAQLKKLGEYLTPVRFDYETPARLHAWMGKHFAAEQIVASPEQRNTLIAKCGRSMMVLEQEIDKLSYYLHAVGRDHLTDEDIAFVTSETPEIDAFDFSNAILERDGKKALTILSDMKLHRQRPELILGSIVRVINDLYLIRTAVDAGLTVREAAAKLSMHAYKAGLYWKAVQGRSASRLQSDLERCAAADLQIKSSALDSYLVLDILTASLCAHGKESHD